MAPGRAGVPRRRVMLDGERIQWLNDTARVHLRLDLTRDAGRPLTHSALPSWRPTSWAATFSRPCRCCRPTRWAILSLQVIPYGESQRSFSRGTSPSSSRASACGANSSPNVLPRAAHAAHVDHRVRRDPARRDDPASAQRYHDLMATQSIACAPRRGPARALLAGIVAAPPKDAAVDVGAMVKRSPRGARPSAGATASRPGRGAVASRSEKELRARSATW